MCPTAIAVGSMRPVVASEFEGYRCRVNAAVVASEYKGYRYRVNAAEGRRQCQANMKAIAVGSMRPKAAGSGERL